MAPWSLYFDVFSDIGLSNKDFILRFAYIWLSILFYWDISTCLIAKDTDMFYILSDSCSGFFKDNDQLINLRI